MLFRSLGSLFFGAKCAVLAIAIAALLRYRIGMIQVPAGGALVGLGLLWIW